jgi:hypothetical protein
MLEKISNLAERVATNVSASRRGFLARLGQAALGVAGVVAGLLVLPREAQALSYITRACQVDYYGFLTGICIDRSSGRCRWCWGCPSGSRPGGLAAIICGYRVASQLTCRCP